MEEKVLPDENEETKEETMPSLTAKDVYLIGTLVFVNLIVAILYSCIGPFFPGEAHRKGATQQEVGLIFGIFEVARCLSAPVYGKLIPIVGAKRMYITGILGTGTCVILFGMLEYLTVTYTFVGLCFLVRICKGLFAAALVTASYPIIADHFPERVGSIVGLLSSGIGLGHTIGPLIGAALFQLGGFKLPFIVLGALLYISSITSLLLIPSATEHNAPSGKSGEGFLRLMAKPTVALMWFSVLSNATGLGFYLVSFELHLQSFNLSPLMVGVMFLIVPGSYSTTCTVSGMLLDRYHALIPLMMFIGAVSMCLGMLTIGPAPFLPFEKTLQSVIISCLFLGCGVGLTCIVQAFPMSLQKAKEYGYPDNMHTFATVSAIFQSMNSMGDAIGPMLVGGTMLDHLGFALTSTIESAELLLLVVLLMIWCIWSYFESRKVPPFPIQYH